MRTLDVQTFCCKKLKRFFENYDVSARTRGSFFVERLLWPAVYNCNKNPKIGLQYSHLQFQRNAQKHKGNRTARLFRNLLLLSVIQRECS